MSPDELVGTTLDGRYQLVRIIGGGAMGCVYEATHAGTGRKVAVKVISTGDATKNQALVARFQREAKAAGAIDTQYIAQVLDTGTDATHNLPYMVMEYLVGEDLQQLLARIGPIAPDLCLRFTAQACIGLGKAHDAGVVHRDIKPANLYVARREQEDIILKLLDFGIAKIKLAELSGMESGGLTRTGNMLGSPLYMSPEQARGAKTIDHRADIWSLGIVMYQSLTGQTPYHHIEALGELIIAICSEAPRPVQELAPWVPPEVAAIVHRALSFDPAARFQTAGEMLDAIRPLLPMGFAVTEAMLVPLTSEERGRKAVRFDVPSQVVRPSALPPPMTGPPTERTGVAAASDGGTESGVARSPSPAKGSGAARIAAAAVGVAVLAAFGVYKLLPGAPAPGPVAAAATEAALSKTPAPTPSQAASPGPTVAPAPADRTVKLVVLPETAKIEIDGTPVATKNGVVEVSGPLGSVHKVKMTVGKTESVEDVVVTENGAMPPKVELDLRPGGGPKKPPTGPSGAPSTAPAPPTTATPAPNGIDKTFQ